MLATVSGTFGALIVFLTGVALYAFCNYMLAFRRRELAIRAGLGAAPRNLIATLLRETAIVLTVGLALGLGSILVLQRLLSGFIVNIGQPSPDMFIQVALILIAVVLAASALPTIQALRMNVARALRVE